MAADSYPCRQPDLPIPISRLASRYFLFSAPIIAWLRRHHQVNGVLAGTLPQSPQQNLFLGLPLELMPEEAAVLVDNKIGSIVDDVVVHHRAIAELDHKKRADYMAAWRAEGRKEADAAKDAMRQRAGAALDRLQGEKKELAQRALERKAEAAAVQLSSKARPLLRQDNAGRGEVEVFDDEDDLLFPAYAQASTLSSSVDSLASNIESTVSSITRPTIPSTMDSRDNPLLPEDTYFVTPTLSGSLIARTAPQSTPTTLSPSASQVLARPAADPHIVVPPTYPLYAYLASLGYFLSPGLRFGCTYMAYPGDPLRYHSHFLVVGSDWDEEMDLLTLIGGGRLGTGVKKGFLLGGRAPPSETASKATVLPEDSLQAGTDVRCFCIEWAGM